MKKAKISIIGLVVMTAVGFTLLVPNSILAAPDGIVDLWELEENGGPYADEIGTNDGAANTDAPTQAGGQVGFAQDFDDTDDEIDIPSSTDFDWLATDSFSIEFWVNTSNAGGNRVVIGRFDAAGTVWWVGVQDTSGLAVFYLGDTNGDTIDPPVGPVGEVGSGGATAIADGNWHHVVAVRDGGTDTNAIYVDSVLQESVVGAGPSYSGDFSSLEKLTIGYLNVGGMAGFFRLDGSTKWPFTTRRWIRAKLMISSMQAIMEIA